MCNVNRTRINLVKYLQLYGLEHHANNVIGQFLENIILYIPIQKTKCILCGLFGSNLFFIPADYLQQSFSYIYHYGSHCLVWQDHITFTWYRSKKTRIWNANCNAPFSVFLNHVCRRMNTFKGNDSIRCKWILLVIKLIIMRPRHMETTDFDSNFTTGRATSHDRHMHAWSVLIRLLSVICYELQCSLKTKMSQQTRVYDNICYHAVIAAGVLPDRNAQ